MSGRTAKSKISTIIFTTDGHFHANSNVHSLVEHYYFGIIL